MGVLNYPAQASPAWGDQSGRGQDLIDAIPNRAWVLASTLRHATRGQMMIGFWPTTSLNDQPNFALYTVSNFIQPRAATITTGIDLAYNAATDYPFAVVWLENAYQLLTKRSGVWYRDWVENAAHSQNYVGFSNYSAVGTLEDRWVLQSQKADLFAPDISLDEASVGAGSLSAALPQMPAYDFFMRFVMDTKPSAGRYRFAYRYQDADNYLYLDINSTGNTIVGERIGGVDSDLDTSPTPASDGDRLTIINDHYRVQVWAENTLIQDSTYTSDNENQLQDWVILDLGTGGVVTDMEIYPYRLQTASGLGSDLIVNGDFDTDTDWVKGANWTIPGGAGADHSGGNDDLEATVDPLTAGKVYKATFTISAYVAGTLGAVVGTPSFPAYRAGSGSANGTFEGYELAETDGAFKMDSTSFQGTVDDVVVQEVLFTATPLAFLLDSVLGL